MHAIQIAAAWHDAVKMRYLSAQAVAWWPQQQSAPHATAVQQACCPRFQVALTSAVWPDEQLVAHACWNPLCQL